MSAIGIPLRFGIAIVAVLVASFAATTLDTATRLQRYVVQELGSTLRIIPLTNKYVATGGALSLAFAVAMSGPKGYGNGGLMLWPLFGATNQLLAGLAFLVTMFYLWRRGKPVYFVAIPAVIMLILPAWAMLWNLFNQTDGFVKKEQHMLTAFAVMILFLQVWIVIEALLMLPKAKGVLEETLPPLEGATSLAGGRSC